MRRDGGIELTARRKAIRGLGNVTCAGISLGLWLLWGTAIGAGWDWTASLGGDVTYTDNVDLEPSGEERSDLVLVITPAIAASRTGAQANASVAYRLQSVIHKDDASDDEVFHQLDARGRSEVGSENLSIFGRATVDQEITDPTDVVGDITNAGDKLTNTFTALVAPEYITRLGNAAQFNARVSYGIVEYDDDDVPDTNQRTASAGVGSVERGRRWRWGASGLIDEVRADDGEKSTLSNVRANTGYQFTNQVGVDGEVGYERNEATDVDTDAISGSFWNVLLNWLPSPRQTLTVGIGERFYGDTYLLRWERRGRLTTSLSYEESLDSSTRDQLQVPSEPGAETPPSLATGIEVLFLRKRADLNLGYARSKTSIAANFYAEEIRYQEQTGADPESDTDLVGLSLTANWRYKPLITWSGTLRAQERDFIQDERTDDLHRLELSGTRRMRSDLTGRVQLSFSDNDSTDSEESFEENAITVGIAKTF
jgi:hypothetical protein